MIFTSFLSVGGVIGGKVKESEFYYCPECEFLVAKKTVKYVEETSALFKDLPPLIRFLCPRCETLVTVKEELI